MNAFFLNQFPFLTHFFLVLHLLNENYGCRGARRDASWFDRSGQGGCCKIGADDWLSPPLKGTVQRRRRHLYHSEPLGSDTDTAAICCDRLPYSVSVLNTFKILCNYYPHWAMRAMSSLFWRNYKNYYYLLLFYLLVSFKTMMSLIVFHMLEKYLFCFFTSSSSLIP